MSNLNRRFTTLHMSTLHSSRFALEQCTCTHEHLYISAHVFHQISMMWWPHTCTISHSAQNNKIIYIYSRLLVSAHNVPAEAVAADIVQRLLCRQTQHFACVKYAKYVHVPYAGVWPTVCISIFIHKNENISDKQSSSNQPKQSPQFAPQFAYGGLVALEAFRVCHWCPHWHHANPTCGQRPNHLCLPSRYFFVHTFFYKIFTKTWIFANVFVGNLIYYISAVFLKIQRYPRGCFDF